MKFDKINIYVPEKVGKILESDANLFELYKHDAKTINRNRFLSMLIKGYYTRYEEESKRILSDIQRLLTELSDNRSVILEKSLIILNEIFRQKVPARKGKNPVRLSLKPTKETEPLINHILDELGCSDYISQYFCRLLMSYCEKPFYEREQIVFSENYKLISDACSSRQGIMFTTIWNSENNHYVCPYKIVVGTEELFNYLLCCETDTSSQKLQTRAYRLNRISHPMYNNKVIDIPEEVLKHLQMMENSSPQYAINSDDEIVVKLTNAGEKTYGRIYYGRPKINKIETNGDEHYYHFNCSEDQIFLYFRRFEGDEAIIIKPDRLRKRMLAFHQKAYQSYLSEDTTIENKENI